MRYLFVYIIEVNVLSTPFEIVDKFALTVAFLQNEGVLKKFTKFIYDIHM